MITQMWECYVYLPQHKSFEGAVIQAIGHYREKYGHDPFVLYIPPDVDVEAMVITFGSGLSTLYESRWKRAKIPYFNLGMERDEEGEL